MHRVARRLLKLSKTKFHAGNWMIAFRNTGPLIQMYNFAILISLVDWHWYYLSHIGVFVLWQYLFFTVIRSQESRSSSLANPVVIEMLERLERIEKNLDDFIALSNR